MHSATKLTRVLRELLALIEEEAGRNPAFAQRLESITEALPTPSERKRAKAKPSAHGPQLPDVFAACQEKGEVEFRYWLRGLDLVTLKALVKANGFDPGKATRHWTEPDKYVALIADQAVARLRRGSAFLAPSRTPHDRDNEG